MGCRNDSSPPPEAPPKQAIQGVPWSPAPPFLGQPGQSLTYGHGHEARFVGRRRWQIPFQFFPAPGGKYRGLIWMTSCSELLSVCLFVFQLYGEKLAYLPSSHCSSLLPVPSHHPATGQSLEKSWLVAIDFIICLHPTPEVERWCNGRRCRAAEVGLSGKSRSADVDVDPNWAEKSHEIRLSWTSCFSPKQYVQHKRTFGILKLPFLIAEPGSKGLLWTWP